MQGQTALCPELFPADFMGFSRCQKGGLSRICSLVSDSRVRCDDSEKARLEATDPVMSQQLCLSIILFHGLNLQLIAVREI